MKNKLFLIIILFINIVFSYFLMKLGNGLLFYLFVDFIVWVILYFLYEFIINRKVILNKALLVEYIVYYLLNFLCLLIIFMFFKIGFLKTKFLALLLITLLLFLQEKFNIVFLKKIFPYLFLLNIAIFFGLSSPMSPLGNKNSAIDSSVFRYIGTVMAEDKTPYVDVFDHKGILLYMINYFGIILNEKVGIWIIEIIMLFCSLVFSYKLARLFTNKFNSIIATIISFIPLVYTFEGGNLTEEYAILFIMISLYLFTRDLKKYNLIKLNSAFIIGTCLGAVLLLRPNMIAIWVCMAIYLLIIYLKEKEYKELFKIIGSFVSGIIVSITPFIIYLVYNGAFNDFINQYLLFNFKYSSRETANTLISTFNFFIENCKYVYLVLFIYILKIIRDKNKNGLMCFYIASLLLSFILIIMPKNLYAHYGMVIIPTFVVAFAIMFDHIYSTGLNFLNNNSLKKIFILLLLYTITCNDINTLIVNIDNKILEYDYLIEITKMVDENTNKYDSILIYGNQASIYLKTGRRASQKYIYQFPIINIDNDIRKDFVETINNNKPKLIVANKNQAVKIEDIISNFLEYYTKLDSNDYNYYFYKLEYDKEVS